MNKLQILLEEQEHTVVHMLGVVASFELVVVVRIELHLKLFACIDESLYVLHRVLYMYVVISHSVYDQHITRQVIGFAEQRSILIAVVIDLRSAHVALGICRVI